ncbi:SGS domain containing protein [Entamoeba histolytica HM-1:IMSS-B]|uniref:Chaperone binding protein n=6 Tax=Entamoeba histolytica TaxID=5759 RepID=C4LYW6_ENTH1|nr:hypothetical protein, conserved [Entamoeba histolytica HM-1:IMSS]EMD42732.1 chaperone -binding protein, putative [Entamoeba histolytica KU27]EMH73188.1 SGS domain containing protein [Entamoeba histolytica HM-1:IMSS-B]EMS15696.1 chaperone binding protein, putative [Entamoeba histolytica HM-3:IMSS]ENY63352.1 chaperone binding protein, putative [Entamoeba histolytica HM-1:IMSS-A]GAT94033.1 hypothetical protein conserved [Entamoeba histolytica]|eukprot:XP_656074.1 hypothetical protein, conserved [Entamoeba histolytica HM-1:IMSS]
MSLRYDWYQLKDYVVIDVFEKNIPKENVTITFEDEQVTIEVKKGEEILTQIIDHLYGSYIIDQSTYRVGAVKIEIKLKKSDASQWENLTKTQQNHHQQSATNIFRKDWNSVDKELETELKDDEKEGGPNAMFQQLYANATDDQRRAMNKSFLESGGTCLNMNWEEVGKKKVEGSAPEGAIMKKWGED